MLRLIPTLLLCVPVVAQIGAHLKVTWEDDGASAPGGTLATMTSLDKDIITVGYDQTLTGTVNANNEIEGGNITFMLAVDGLVSETWTGNICEKFTMHILSRGVGKIIWNGASCPMPAGENGFKVDVNLAAYLPSTLVNADVTINAVTPDHEQILVSGIHLRPTKSDMVAV